MAIIQSMGVKQLGNLVKTDWVSSGSSNQTICTNATIGNMYIASIALYNATVTSVTGGDIIYNFKQKDDMCVVIIKATSETMSFTFTGTGVANMSHVDELIIE